MTANRDDYDRYESLPDWAQATLRKHMRDRREYVYSLDELAAAETHDEVWNAAQRQLAREGRIHNYLRMLWGKKILEWTANPRDAIDIMIELNNRFAVDGATPIRIAAFSGAWADMTAPGGPNARSLERCAT